MPTCVLPSFVCGRKCGSLTIASFPYGYALYSENVLSIAMICICDDECDSQGLLRPDYGECFMDLQEFHTDGTTS